MVETARTVFENSYKALTTEFGFGPMSDADINKVGRRWFRKKWAGVGTADSRISSAKKPPHDRYFVLNTGHDGSPGMHWVGMYRSPRGEVYAFDSFGRNLSVLLPRVARAVAQEGHGRAVDANRDEIQSDNTDVCGHLSLSWLNTVHLAGLSSTTRLLAHSPRLLHAVEATVHGHRA